MSFTDYTVETLPGKMASVQTAIKNLAAKNGVTGLTTETLGSSYVFIHGADIRRDLLPLIEKMPDVKKIEITPQHGLHNSFAAAVHSDIKKFMLKIDDQHIGPGFKEVSQALVTLGRDEPRLKMGEYWDSPGVQFVEAPQSLKEKLEKIPGVYEVAEMQAAPVAGKPSGPKFS